MLASISPLVERGKRQRWGVTVSFFVLGGLVAGTACGAFLGWAGSLLSVSELPDEARAAVLAAALVAGVILDARVGGAQLPTIRRQVNELWLNRYRGWVYGFGFGAQLAVGALTIVTISGIYAVQLAEFLSTSWQAGAVIGAAFGLARTLPLLGGAGIVSPEALSRASARIAALARPARTTAIACEVAVAAALVLTVTATALN